jgi:hypothetical protein
MMETSEIGHWRCASYWRLLDIVHSMAMGLRGSLWNPNDDACKLHGFISRCGRCSHAGVGIDDLSPMDDL